MDHKLVRALKQEKVVTAVSVTMTGSYRRYFFLMAAERKMEPMNSIFGRLTNYVATKILFRGEVPHVDNSDAGVACPVK